MTIRAVEERDVDAVVGLVHELAEYERAAEHCLLTPAQLHAALFAPAPALFGHVAEVGRRASSAARCGSSTSRPGAACTASTSKTSTCSPPTGAPGSAGRCSRGSPASARSAGSPAWSGRCSTGTTPSIGFYRSLGAVTMDEWTVFRLDGAALEALGRDG